MDFIRKASIENVDQITPFDSGIFVLQHRHEGIEPYFLSTLNRKSGLNLIIENLQNFFMINNKIIYNNSTGFFSYDLEQRVVVELSSKKGISYHYVNDNNLILRKIKKSDIKKGNYSPYAEFLVQKNGEQIAIPIQTDLVFKEGVLSWVKGNKSFFSGYKKTDFDGKIIWEINYNKLFSEEYEWSPSEHCYKNKLIFVELKKKEWGGYSIAALEQKTGEIKWLIDEFSRNWCIDEESIFFIKRNELVELDVLTGNKKTVTSYGDYLFKYFGYHQRGPNSLKFFDDIIVLGFIDGWRGPNNYFFIDKKSLEPIGIFKNPKKSMAPDYPNRDGYLLHDNHFYIHNFGNTLDVYETGNFLLR